MKSLIFVSCKEATLDILKKEQAELGFLGGLKLSLHFSLCSICKEFARQSSFINTQLRNLKHEIKYTPDEISQLKAVFPPH